MNPLLRYIHNFFSPAQKTVRVVRNTKFSALVKLAAEKQCELTRSGRGYAIVCGDSVASFDNLAQVRDWITAVCCAPVNPGCVAPFTPVIVSPFKDCTAIGVTDRSAPTTDITRD